MSTTGVSFAAVGALAMCSLIASAPPPASVLAGDHDPIRRFLTSEGASLVAYEAVRRLEAQNERHNADGWLDACTELTPADGFRYRVMAEGGSGLIRGRVLRKALEGERGAWTSGEIGASALAPANYEFADGDSTEDGLLTVLLKPRRRSRMLVEGVMFLNPHDGDLVRVEGTLAKGPSFWTPRVDVVRRYERIAGVRVPVALESVAHVRWVGRSSFRMSYRYLSVNGHDVDSAREACTAVETDASWSPTPAIGSDPRDGGSHVH